MKIFKDCFVIIEYTVRLDDGTIVKGGNPPAFMNFVVGYNQVIPALEKKLIGAEEGQNLSFTIPFTEAFGPYRSELVKFKTFDEFPEGKNLEIGKWVIASNEKTGAKYSYFVKDKEENGVWLDFNHPLAGKNMNYEVKIVKVRPATREELEFLRPCEFGKKAERE